MSLLDYVEAETDNESFIENPDIQAADRTDVFNASYLKAQRLDTSWAKDRAVENLILERNRKFEEITQKNLQEELKKFDPDFARKFHSQRARHELSHKDELFELYERFFSKQREEQPVLFGELRSREELEKQADIEAKKAHKDYVHTLEGAPDDWLTWVFDFAGQAAAQIHDPVNLGATVFETVYGGVSKTLLTKMIRSATINMATEAVVQPEIAAYQESLGIEYGARERVFNILAAGAFGAGAELVGAAGRGAYRRVFKNTEKSDSIVMDHISEEFKNAGELDGARIADIEAERVRLNDFDVSKASDDVPYKAHLEALEEVGEAARTGRGIETDRLPVSERALLDADPKKVTDNPVLRAELEEMQAAYRANIEAQKNLPPKPKQFRLGDQPDAFQKTQSELFPDKESPEARTFEAQKEKAQRYNSMDADLDRLARLESEDFDFDDDFLIESTDGRTYSVSDLKKQFKDELDYQEAMTFCRTT